ncbi:hypothetical protein DERF_004662 [Dermatophagoides farinae]|uniref:Uncharacterized protein n=1 Tax=Dermatophagoides farinae TaxID=6954 RepID=A0A922I1X2_DERFA|nr:hypothetical protein DERF_004662 [Dermatophagoides farinae]
MNKQNNGPYGENLNQKELLASNSRMQTKHEQQQQQPQSTLLIFCRVIRCDGDDDKMLFHFNWNNRKKNSNEIPEP